MFEHKDTRRFDEAGRNKAAECRMLEVIEEAAAVDTRCFVSDAGQHSNDEHVERVDVLQAGFQKKAYTMCAPASRYAACTCATAMQRIICKHQVAWLVELAPLDRRAEAERLCVRMLGTRLHYRNRVGMDLQIQAPAAWSVGMDPAPCSRAWIGTSGLGALRLHAREPLSRSRCRKGEQSRKKLYALQLSFESCVEDASTCRSFTRVSGAG
jgi:hypothetical protein